jgi:hypothetical protein
MRAGRGGAMLSVRPLWYLGGQQRIAEMDMLGQSHRQIQVVPVEGRVVRGIDVLNCHSSKI